MLLTVILLLITCGIIQSSEIHPVAPAGSAPIVTAASSQYFERTFNRLVAAPPVFEPVLPVAPAPIAPVFPVPPPRPFLSVLPIGSTPPVVVEATKTTLVPANPTNPPPPAPVDPNIAIAIATAHAAPVATILLPPYPFGFPPSFGVLPQGSQTPSGAPVNPNTRESTTLKTTTTAQATTTQRVEDPTTPVPSNTDINFAQASSSNENVNFRQYLAPQPPTEGSRNRQAPAVRPQEFPRSNVRPQQFPIPSPRPQQLPATNAWPQQIPQHLPLPDSRPIKFKTNVEVVPVPLAYIAPPLPHQHHHHHHHHHHQALKVVPHIHKFIPKTSKIIIIRPVTSSRLRTVRVPAGFATYGPPKLLQRAQNIQSGTREPITFRPINRYSKPPRL